jgi:hypothetical protein
MSGRKASSKQPEDMILTAADEALNELHHSHRDAVPLKDISKGKKQPEEGKCGEEDQQAGEQKKARTTVRATTVEQPSEPDKEKTSLDLLCPDRLPETQTPAELNMEGDDMIEARKLRAAGAFKGASLTDALAAYLRTIGAGIGRQAGRSC